jgi:hypothetical protein
MSLITNKPIIAEALVYVSGDTIAPVAPATDAGGDLDLDNMIDPNVWAVTSDVGRTATSVAVNSGVKVTLASQTSVSIVQLLNVDDDPLPAGTRLEILGEVAGPSTTFQASAGSGHYIRPSDIWTTHGSKLANNPIRPIWIPGVDDLTTPAQPGTPTVTPWNCLDLTITWETTGTSYLEIAGIALGINAVELSQSIRLENMTTKPAQLYAGWGHRWDVTFPLMSDTDATLMENLWAHSEGGQTPVFFCPAPGERATADGAISGAQHDPALQGGLMRFLSFSRQRYGEAGSETLSNVSASFETWQEVPTGAL